MLVLEELETCSATGTGKTHLSAFDVRAVKLTRNNVRLDSNEPRMLRELMEGRRTDNAHLILPIRSLLAIL